MSPESAVLGITGVGAAAKKDVQGKEGGKISRRGASAAVSYMFFPDDFCNCGVVHSAFLRSYVVFKHSNAIIQCGGQALKQNFAPVLFHGIRSVRLPLVIGDGKGRLDVSVFSSLQRLECEEDGFFWRMWSPGLGRARHFNREEDSGSGLGGMDGNNEDLPSMGNILAAAEEKGVRVELKSFGPFFNINATSLAGAALGQAGGFILPWFDGRILHLDWIRLTKMSSQNRTGVLGVGLFIGAVAIRHGFDSSCIRAELLAINDSPAYHTKLVRYYSRLGFTTVYEVTGERLQDFPHLLVWGGVGTRMDADPKYLLRKWTSSLRPSNKLSTEGQSTRLD